MGDELDEMRDDWDDLVCFRIAPQNKKSIVDVVDIEMTKDKLERTTKADYNWNGQKRRRGSAWRGGSGFLCSMSKKDYEALDIDDFNDEWEELHFCDKYLESKGWEFHESGDMFDGDCWDWVIWLDKDGNEIENGSDEQEQLEEQFNEVWDFDGGDTLTEDDEYVDTYIIGPYEIEECDCRKELDPNYAS